MIQGTRDLLLLLVNPAGVHEMKNLVRFNIDRMQLIRSYFGDSRH